MYGRASLLQEYLTRTLANLVAIENLKAKGESVFETTQLINSLLGLIVFPRQSALSRIPKMQLASLRSKGWTLPLENNQYMNVTELRELVTSLRHAIAHFNIEFISDNSNSIGAIKFWNTKPQTTTRIWEATFEVAMLRSFIAKLIEVLLKEEDAGHKESQSV